MFTQFVLLPLAVLYLGILYAYPGWERREWLTNRLYELTGFEHLGPYAQPMDSTAE